MERGDDMPELRDYERDDLIIQMADAMIEYDWRLLDIVSNFGYALTTVHRWITDDLRFIDDDKFIQCKHIIERHKHDRMPRGGRY
jgi:hypothetical protein